MVYLLALVGFCLCKKYGLEKSLFWSRVSMFPLLILLFVCAVISSFEIMYFDLHLLTVTVLGYIWHFLLFVILMCKKCRCSCYRS